MRRICACAALAAAALLGGCGGTEGVVGGTGQGPLKWAEEPLMFTPATLPGDRVLTGYLRNDSVRRVRVDLPDVRVLARSGAVVTASPVFLNTFGKSLWSPGRCASTIPTSCCTATRTPARSRAAWARCRSTTCPCP